MIDKSSGTYGQLHITRGAFLRGLAAAVGAASLTGANYAQGAPEKMQTRPIPSSGAQLPVVGCGTWRTFDVGSSPAEREPLANVLRVLADAGGSAIDSSPMYGPAEGVVGDLLDGTQTREKFFIATKVWTSGRSAGLAQMEQSMARFRTERIDLMQVHNLLDWRTHLSTLRSWKRDGRIGYLGVTHYTSSAYDELEAVMRAEQLDFVQLNYSLNDRAAEKVLLPLARDKGIAIIVNQPFGGGGLLRTLLPRPLPAFAAEIGCESWAQYLLKFVLGHPAVTCVIPGTGKPEYMRDNVRAGFGVMPDATIREKMLTVLGS